MKTEQKLEGDNGSGYMNSQSENVAGRENG